MMNEQNVFGTGDNKIDDKLLWAFAVDATKPLKVSVRRSRREAKPKYNLHRYYVTVCSPKLKEFGVRAGMRYDEAKRLVPNMHIFVYNR
jgi:hypothetical protein